MASIFNNGVILIILLYFRNYAFGSCEANNDSYNYECDNFKEEASFTEQLINKHLHHCHLVHLRYQNQPSSNIRNIPTIDINFMQDSSERALQSLKVHKRDYIIRFQRQCIVYLISLQFATLSSVESISEIFTSHQLQIQSQESFIVLHEKMHEEMVETFMFLPQIKNYPHRIWVDTKQNEDENYSRIKFYCYYCDNGNPALSSNKKLYSDVNEILNLEEIFPDVTKNFVGYNLRVTAAKAIPLSHVVPSPDNPKIKIIEGMQANILETIAKSLNFTYTILNPSGGTGFKLANGTWTGIMGDILHGEIDMGVNVATTYERNKVIDFTVSVFYAFLVLVSTKPTPVFEWQAIFYPFTALCWMAVLICTLSAMVLYQFLQNKSAELEIQPDIKTHSNYVIQEKIKKEKVSIFESFYLTVGSLLEQGIPYEFHTVPARTFAIFWMFFAIIITCAYRSKLFAFLTFPSTETPPSSFKELGSSRYTWGMKSLGGVALLFVTKSPTAYVRSVGEKMEVYTDKYSCIDKTFSSRFTCIVYKAEIDYLLETRYWKVRRKVFLSDFVTPPIGAAWATAKYSPILPKLEEKKFRTFEMGLADRYLTDYQGNVGNIIKVLSAQPNYTGDLFDVNTNYKNDEGDGTNPLAMVNLYGGFFILFFGATVGAAILFTETVRTEKHRKKIRMKQLELHARFHTRFSFMRRNRKVDRNLKLNQVVKLMLPHTNVHQLDFTNRNQNASINTNN